MMAMSEAPSPSVTETVAPNVSALETVQAQNLQLREQVAKLEHQLKQLQRLIFEAAFAG